MLLLVLLRPVFLVPRRNSSLRLLTLRRPMNLPPRPTPPLCKQMRHLWFIRALWGFVALCIENKTPCVFSCRAGGGAFPAAPLALGLRVGPRPLPRGAVTSTFSPVASDERLVLTRVLTGAAARRVTAPVGGERGSLARPHGAGTWAWGRGQTEQAGLQAPPTKSRARVLIRGWR